MQLEKERLENLRGLFNTLQEKKMELADAVLSISALESKRNQSLMQVKTTKKKIEVMIEELKKEYGDVNINLINGEITPEESQVLPKKITRRRTKSK